MCKTTCNEISAYLYTSLIFKYSCPYLVSLGAFDSLLSLLPHISLSSRSSPDQSLRSTWNLLVDIQCVDMGSKHVVPEAQTHASAWGGLVDPWWNHGPLTWTSRGGGLHVDIESYVQENTCILVTVLVFFYCQWEIFHKHGTLFIMNSKTSRIKSPCPVVWSLSGPVPMVGELMFVLDQSKSSFWSCVYPHHPDSNVQFKAKTV